MSSFASSRSPSERASMLPSALPALDPRRRKATGRTAGKLKIIKLIEGFENFLIKFR